MESQRNPSPPPHILIFPLPLQGPVNCMLKLAELLTLQDLQVTFLNTDQIQRRLLQFANVDFDYFKKRYPNFGFLTIPDGLPGNEPRTGEQIVQVVESIEPISKKLIKEMMMMGSENNPVSCIIADGVYSFAVEIAEEIGVPLVYFETISPCGLWSYMCLPKLIQSGEFPFKDTDLDAPIINVPEMECMMRRRDLPDFFRFTDANHPLIQVILKEIKNIPKAQALIFNTFEDLDKGTLTRLRTLGPKVYAVGPLHTHLKTTLIRDGFKNFAIQPPPSSYSLWKEDKSCISWLDKQPEKSVVYVSIGSLAVMSKDQLIEIWFGLVNSGSRFLWVQRPGSIIGVDEGIEVPEVLDSKTKEMGCIVSWVPQEEVLRHPAIGGFLTHGGWNSTLESIVEGVPMICWPYFVDQQVNSRYVEEVWKLGLDIKDTCDRVIIENMIKDLMGIKRDDFISRADKMSKLAIASVSEGGSSYNDLISFVEDIKFKRFDT